MSLSTLAAAPAEVTLGGRSYRLSPLRIRDQAEFERWVQERVAAMDPHGEPAAVARRVLAIGFYGQECLQAQRTVEGVGHLVWLGIRRNHPELTYEQMSDAATLEELGAAYRVFNRINYDPEDADMSDASAEPARRTSPTEGVAAPKPQAAPGASAPDRPGE